MLDSSILMLSKSLYLLAYLLCKWNVDCTRDTPLTGVEHYLWLSNIDELAGLLEYCTWK